VEKDETTDNDLNLSRYRRSGEQMKNVIALTISALALVTLATPTHAQVSTQVPFSDTFSGILLDNTFLALSGYRTDTGSVGGGQYGYTSTGINEEVGGAMVAGQAGTIANGFFTARNYASLSVENAEQARYGSQSSHGTHTTVEFFTPTAITPARTRFHWIVSGLTSSTYPGVVTNADLSFAAGYFPTTGFYNFFDLPKQENGGPLLSVSGTGSFSYNLPLLLNQPIDLFYHSAAYTYFDAQGGETFSGFADFRNTHILDRIELFDSNDVPIPEWGMREISSGLVMFDQNGRTAAANGNAPEPGTLALLALGGVAFLSRRRK
jgi:PEP-CTERM motif